MSTVAIVQARMGSSRLPGKVLRPILGRPMLSLQLERLQRVRQIDRVVVATSDHEGDDPIETCCRDLDVDCFRGSEQDVLDRFYRAAEAYGADPLLRLTADCPLVDPGLIGRLIDRFRGADLDHMGIACGADVANEESAGRFPDGLDAEIMTFAALERAWRETDEPLHREHVTLYIWKNPGRFRVGSLTGETDHGDQRWTVDHEEDFALVEQIFERLYPHKADFDYRDVLDLLDRDRRLVKMNRQHAGAAAYRELED